MLMKRILIGALIVIFAFAGVAMAAETAVPTLADVLTAIQELKADVAQLKADGFTYSEIAAAAGLRVASVGRLIARALDRLSRELNSLGAQP
jgi:DNA-directed RNA polymerase specialized sigma24 family protein